MPLNDYQLALQCQQQYDGLIGLRTIAGVVHSVIVNDDAVDIIFRGTADLSDAKRDLEALMVSCPFGRVHGGAWAGIQAALDASMPAGLPPTRKIRLSGHSLGAMRAAMAAAELFRRGRRNLECVTFGCPRWGDTQAIDYFNQIDNKTYRNYNNLFEHDFFLTIPLPLPEERYGESPNPITGWSAPTDANEWKDEGEQIEAHSLKDCYCPLVQRACAGALIA